MTEQLLVEIFKDVPALTIFALIVFWFLKHLRASDKAHQDVLQELTRTIEQNTSLLIEVKNEIIARYRNYRP